MLQTIKAELDSQINRNRFNKNLNPGQLIALKAVRNDVMVRYLDIIQFRGTMIKLVMFTESAFREPRNRGGQPSTWLGLPPQHPHGHLTWPQSTSLILIWRLCFKVLCFLLILDFSVRVVRRRRNLNRMENRRPLDPQLSEFLSLFRHIFAVLFFMKLLLDAALAAAEAVEDPASQVGVAADAASAAAIAAPEAAADTALVASPQPTVRRIYKLTCF